MAFFKFFSAVRAKCLCKAACIVDTCRLGGGSVMCRSVDRIFFIVTQMAFANGAVHKAVGVPGTKIKVPVSIFNRVFAGFTNLLIGKSAVPLFSLICHIILSFRYSIKVCVRPVFIEIIAFCLYNLFRMLYMCILTHSAGKGNGHFTAQKRPYRRWKHKAWGWLSFCWSKYRRQLRCQTFLPSRRSNLGIL